MGLLSPAGKERPAMRETQFDPGLARPWRMARLPTQYSWPREFQRTI